MKPISQPPKVPAVPACSLSRLWLALSVMALALVAMPVHATDHYRHFIVGNPRSPTGGPVSAGLLLLGGGDRNYAALRWFAAKAGHGHIVVLRASLTTDDADDLFYHSGGVASVETFVFDARAEAADPRVLDSLSRADGVFISGGDQARYLRFWKGTPVAAALDAHVAAGKPLAGTSAGLAMLGEYLYGATDGGSIASAAALADPFGSAVTMETDFLHISLLRGVVTDTHFEKRHRLGRLFAFVAKAEAMSGQPPRVLRGLGVDEDAAVAVDADGTARIFATTPTAGASLVIGGFAESPTRGQPLSASRIHVIGVGAQSRLDLVHWSVRMPAFERDYSVAAGRITDMSK